MYYIYLLNSTKDSGFYIGYSKDLRRRQDEHQRGLVKSTKNRRPIKLIYYEAYNEKEQAQKRERNLKKYGSAYYGLLKRLGIK